LKNGRVCHRGKPVSLLFLDFNTDTLLSLHRKQDLSPLLTAVREGRVINPRGTGPINVKSVFELITGPYGDRFHPETVSRTPWTRKFYPRQTTGPKGEAIDDLIEWTRKYWDTLVLKPERGYSGKGVRVGGIHGNIEESTHRLKCCVTDFSLSVSFWRTRHDPFNIHHVHNSSWHYYK